LKKRVNLLAQSEDGLAENCRVCEQGRLRGRDGRRGRREGGGALTGVQPSLEGIAVGGLTTAAARENGGGNGRRNSNEHGRFLYYRIKRKTCDC